jgi:hypothetical protein
MPLVPDKPTPTTEPPPDLRSLLPPHRIKEILDGQMIWTADEKGEE